MTEKDFSSLKDILERSPTMKLLREYARTAELSALWEQVVGSEVSTQTRVLRYRGGKLVVEVSSSPLLLELSSFRKQEIIGRLREAERLRGLVDIIFRNA